VRPAEIEAVYPGHVIGIVRVKKSVTLPSLVQRSSGAGADHLLLSPPSTREDHSSPDQLPPNFPSTSHIDEAIHEFVPSSSSASHHPRGFEAFVYAYRFEGINHKDGLSL